MAVIWKDCKQTRAAGSQLSRRGGFWLIDAWCQMIDTLLLLGQVAAAAELHQFKAVLRFHRGRKRRTEAIDHSGWQANIMSASADNDVIDMGVRGWRGY